MNFIKKYRIHMLIGAFAGIINGLLGAGGGIIITYYLHRVLKDEEKLQNGVFANAVATMLPISTVSLMLYFNRKYIALDKELFLLIPSAIIGGILGAFLLTKLKFKIVKLLFAILVIVSGFFVVFK